MKSVKAMPYPKSMFALLLVALAFAASAVPAAEPGGNSPVLVPPREKIASFQCDLAPFGLLTFVPGRQEGAVGHFDELILFAGPNAASGSDGGVGSGAKVGSGTGFGAVAGSGTIVFKTEGRKLVDVQTCDFSAQGLKDVVLTLDTGGSGGFVDFALLSVASQSVVTIWERETVKGGQAAFGDVNGDGRPELLIKGFEEDPATGKISEVKSVYSFSEGKVVEQTDSK